MVNNEIFDIAPLESVEEHFKEWYKKQNIFVKLLYHWDYIISYVELKLRLLYRKLKNL